MIFLNNFIPIRVYYDQKQNHYRLETCKADTDKIEFKEDFISKKLKSYKLLTTLYGLNPRLFPPVPLGTSMFRVYQNPKQTTFETQKMEWIAFPIMTTVMADIGDFSFFAFTTNPGRNAIPVFVRNEENHLKITFDQDIIRDYFLNTPYDKKALDRDNFVIYLFEKPFLYWRGTTEALCVPSDNPSDFPTLMSCQKQTYGKLKNHKSFTGNSGIPLSKMKEQLFPFEAEKKEGRSNFYISLVIFLLVVGIISFQMILKKRLNTQKNSNQNRNIYRT